MTFKVRLSYRWADQKPETVYAAVRNTIDPNPYCSYDNSGAEALVKADNTRDLFAALIEKLHDKGIFTDAEIVDLLNTNHDQWEAVEEES